MKKLFLLSVLIILSLSGYAQGVAISENGAIADASALLDISSHNKGILIPRLRSNERTGITSPVDGLFVYDIDTRSFWYFAVGAWRELMKVGDPVIPGGIAGGDLSGSYPNPNVAKIQNLDVAFGVPFDKQILKWDALSNNWKGRNDSLFLPYNVAFGSSTKLFGIQNNNTTAGSSAICGKSGTTGSGVTPNATMGVWGDNSSGVGVLGSSNTGIGTYGLSFNNHGVYGYGVLANFAGVCGSHANNGGIGVLGDVGSGGYGTMGRSTGTIGKAGFFINTNPASTDTTFIAMTPSQGVLSSFIISNANNTKPAVDILHSGNGNGIKLRLTKTNATANAFDMLYSGTGYGIYGKSENSTTAKFENTNATNVFPVMALANNSTGQLLSINSSNTGVTSNVIDVVNSGQGRALSIASAKGNAGYFGITDATTGASGVSINHVGLGRGEEIVLTKSTNTQAGLWVNTAGTLGIQSNATSNASVAILGTTGPTANDAVAVKGITGASVQNGIGVLGQAGASDPNGIGVKGVAGGAISGGIGVFGEGLSSNPQAIGVKGVGYTHNEDVGAVTGINMTDGVGVFGESLGTDGIGVAGTVGNTNVHAVAAVFTNKYTENNRSVVEVNTNGKGPGLIIDADNLSNSSPLFRILNSGTSQFFRFEDGLGDIRTTLAKSGDFTTDGTVTVKTNKGIVRNSTSTQLRTEILTASMASGNIGHYNEFNASINTDVTFSTAFGSTPSVYIGQVSSGSVQGLTIRIIDVTTTGCTVQLLNFTPYDFNVGASSIKIIAIGAE